MQASALLNHPFFGAVAIQYIDDTSSEGRPVSKCQCITRLSLPCLRSLSKVRPMQNPGFAFGSINPFSAPNPRFWGTAVNLHPVFFHPSPKRCSPLLLPYRFRIPGGFLKGIPGFASFTNFTRIAGLVHSSFEQLESSDHRPAGLPGP